LVGGLDVSGLATSRRFGDGTAQITQVFLEDQLGGCSGLNAPESKPVGQPDERRPVPVDGGLSTASPLEAQNVSQEDWRQLGRPRKPRTSKRSSSKLALLLLLRCLGRNRLSARGEPPVMIACVPVHETGIVYTMTPGLAVCSTN
jgi:hypothetical protein